MLRGQTGPQSSAAPSGGGSAATPHATAWTRPLGAAPPSPGGAGGGGTTPAQPGPGPRPPAHLWYCAWRNWNSSLMRSSDSGMVNLKGWPAAWCGVWRGGGRTGRERHVESGAAGGRRDAGRDSGSPARPPRRRALVTHLPVPHRRGRGSPRPGGRSPRGRPVPVPVPVPVPLPVPPAPPSGACRPLPADPRRGARLGSARHSPGVRARRPPAPPPNKAGTRPRPAPPFPPPPPAPSRTYGVPALREHGSGRRGAPSQRGSRPEGQRGGRRRSVPPPRGHPRAFVAVVPGTRSGRSRPLRDQTGRDGAGPDGALPSRAGGPILKPGSPGRGRLLRVSCPRFWGNPGGGERRARDRHRLGGRGKVSGEGRAAPGRRRGVGSWAARGAASTGGRRDSEEEEGGEGGLRAAGPGRSSAGSTCTARRAGRCRGVPGTKGARHRAARPVGEKKKKD